LQFGDLQELDTAARVLDGSARDDDGLTLQVPGDAGIRSLRALLDRLEHASVDVDSLSIHLPDLDDVFLALTGKPDVADNPDHAGSPDRAGSQNLEREPVR
jgi:ABC-2 type transport system ATP-binding protein